MVDTTANIQASLPSSVSSIAAALDPSQGNLQLQNSVSNGVMPVSQSICFPQGLEAQDFWMSFSFYQYQRPTFSNNPVLKDAGTIRLPLANGLVDSQGVSYSVKPLDPGLGAALNEVSGGRGGSNPLDAISNAAEKGLPAVLGGGAQKIAAAALGQNAPQALLGLAGVTQNPWLTVMFDAPQYKKHALSWTLLPSNEMESLAIAQMITTFKFNMLPDSSGALGGSLLTYPNIVQVTVNNAQGAFWNYIFKPAVIETFSVNYAPTGQPSMFGKTKAPTAVQLSLNLQEIEFFLQRDYGAPNSAGNSNLNALEKWFNS